MAEIDAKVNMSLDDIIKMEKKDKKKKAVAAKGIVGAGGQGGAKRNRNANGARSGNNNPRRGGSQARPGLQSRGASQNRGAPKNIKPNNPPMAKRRRSQQQKTQNIVAAGFVTKRYNRMKNKAKNNLSTSGGGLVRSRSNTTLNRFKNNNANNGVVNGRGGLTARRGLQSKFGLARSRSRTNLVSPTTKRFFANNKGGLKRTNSMPNLRDPTSVHNRLGYQSPAQVVYRNRVKRAKQILLQRQNQRMQMPNDYRVPQNGKTLTVLQQRALAERRQQILAPQRNFNSVGLRSDQILRAQRRAQYAQKLMRINALRMNPNPNVNFMCTLGDDYAPAGIRQRSLSLAQTQNRSAMSNPRQLARARSPFRPNPQHLAALARPPMFSRQPRSRSRSRSRSRPRNGPIVQSTSSVDDRTFSEMMYSISESLGVTKRTLNDRFSF